MKNTIAGILLIATMSRSALCADPAEPPWSPPPAEVALYLAERGIIVSAEEGALVRPASDAALQLQTYGMAPGRELRKDLVLVDKAALRDPLLVPALRSGDFAAAPVLKSKGSRFRVIPLPRVVFRIRDGASLDEASEIVNSLRGRDLRSIRDGEFAAETPVGANAWASLQLAARLSAHAAVEWAVPDCAREVKKTYLPNDIISLWHLRNTNSPPRTNDIVMAPAWDTSLGDPAVVIAVMDDGLDIAHPDISANVWTNPAEIPADGLDNDGNGYTDDINGWDFYVGTNDITPNDADENHGTATAGLAAARGDNGLGVSGACPKCRILPIKLFDGNDFVTDLQWADAIHYARRYAKVISISISSDGALDAQLVSAFNTAATSCVVFASAGNDADIGVYQVNCVPQVGYYGWSLHTQQVDGVGSHTYRWAYRKDSSVSRPGDCMWLDGVLLPNGSFYDFDAPVLPAGWSSGGNTPFFFTPSTGDYMAAGAYSLRSGVITHSQTSWVQVVASGAGAMSFFYQVYGERDCASGSGPFNYDLMIFSIDGTNKWADTNEHPELWGLSFTNLPFPAALTSVIAVGASTIDGYRAAYSQFGTNLGVMAPSGGSVGEAGVKTTDRRGSDGYTAGDYDDAFSGTSASAPIAAGVAGLLFSANLHITAPEVRQLLRDRASKIGGATYGAGFHRFYGHGQVSGAASMRQMLSNMPPEIVTIQKSNNQVRFTTLGIETGRVYNLYRADSVNTSGAWNWQLVNPAATGAPMFGVNITPFWNITATATTAVYRITK